ncbi:MAG TPA: BTAD domain-containing putative transcriptional regulator [Streptosporangiaceae bacterium]
MPAKGVEFGVLGPVQAVIVGRSADLGERKQRLVLAMLALEVNKVIPVSRFADILWSDSPPNSSRRIIQAHVSRLRTALHEAGAAADGTALVRRGSGYLLATDPVSVDAHRFRFLVEDAELRSDDLGKVKVLGEALALWRGPALADAAPDELRQQLCGGLEEARLMAVENLLETRLRLGHHLQVLDELTDLAALHPYRPRITRCLMLALYRAGRTADALRSFILLRNRLRHELGLDPPVELTELHVAILRADPGLSHGQVNLADPAPAQLPADIADFVGRDTDLAALTRLADNRGRREDQAPSAVVITGGAGVGKTALAVHWAHLTADEFPDGQLYVDLRGYAGTAPVTTLDALTSLLHGLGVPMTRIPADERQAAALYRSELAARRMIVVLDNAKSAEHVRPLLPGRSRSVTLVTSRAGLTGLIAREGAARIRLDPLSTDEALTLLAGMIGAARIRREAEQAAQLAQLCSGLPLALRIAAARLLALPHTQIRDYVKEIGDEDGFASLQVDGDDSASVWTAFDLSYLALDPSARRVFRLLGVIASGNLSVHAIAAMNGATAAHVNRALSRLADAHLVEQHSGARFGPHDLLRRYAMVKSKAEDTAPDRQVALQRLLLWYLHGADQATRLFSPFALRLVPPVGYPGQSPEFAGIDEALAWLESERAHMVAALVRAVDQEEDSICELAVQLARRLHSFLFRRGHLANDVQVNRAALKAAVRRRDPAAEAWACISLGAANALLGQDDQARPLFHRALEIARSTTDTSLLANCISNAADVWWRDGETEKVEAALREEIELRVGLGDDYGLAFCELNLGELYRGKALYEQSRGAYEESMRKLHAVGDQYGESLALHGLGCLDMGQGRLDQAAESLNGAATMLRGVKNRSALGFVLVDLGQVYRRQGQSGQAMSCLYEGLRLCRELGMRRREAECLRELSDTLDEIIPEQADSYRQQSTAILGELA